MLLEITIWVNQAQVLDKTLILSHQNMLNNSTINFTSEKILLFLELVISKSVNSMNSLINISVQSKLALKDQSATKINLYSLHLWCSKEMIKFLTQVLVLLSSLQVGMIQISSLCTISQELSENTELTSTLVLIWILLICNITLSTTLWVHIQTLLFTSHFSFPTQILVFSETSFSEMKFSTDKCLWWLKIWCHAMPIK